jgi:hypothetical protein
MRSTESVLNDYADAIQNTTSSQQQLALAFKAFDSEGARLVNTLRNGSEGLADLRQQAVEAGAVMDSSLTRKAEVINDRWDSLSDTIGVKFKSALITAADASLNFLKIYNDLESTLWAIVEAEERLLDAEARIDTQRGRNKKSAELVRDQAKSDLVQLRETESVMRDMEERINRMKESGGVLSVVTGGVTGGNGIDKPGKKDVTEDPEIIYGLQLKDELVRLENQKQYEIWWIRANAQKSYSGFLAKTTKDQTKQVVGELVNMTQGVAQQNKAMFRVNQMAGIANAVINTYQGVTNALAAYPPPLSFAMAAAQMAAGMAQVSAIKSTSFGGGGGAPSLAGSGGAVPTIAVDQQGATVEQATPNTNVEINISGGIHDSNSVRDLIEAINEEVGDGVNLVANIY